MLPAWLIPAGLSALGLIGGAAKSKTSQTTTNTLDPAYSGLQGLLLKQTMSRLNQPQAMTQSQIAGGIGGINDTYRTIQQNIGNRAAQQGQSGGAGELYAMGNADIARGGEIGNYRSVTVPGIERDWMNQDRGFAANLLGQGRYSQTTTGSGGGGVSGALGGLGGMLGYLYGQGGLGNGSPSGGAGVMTPPNGSGPLPGGFGGNGDWWSQMFSQYGG